MTLTTNAVVATINETDLAAVLMAKNMVQKALETAPDLPTAPASDLPTPARESDVDKSPHADIWRHSMRQEFDGLRQANTFVPVQN